MVDLASGARTRITSEPVDAVVGGWSSDGRLVFSRAAGSPPDIFVMSLDKPADAKLLLSADGVQIARHWSADGRTIAYIDQSVGRQERVQVQLMSADGQRREFRQLPGDSFDPRLSPDGRWLGVRGVRIGQTGDLCSTERWERRSAPAVTPRRAAAALARRWP